MRLVRSIFAFGSAALLAACGSDPVKESDSSAPLRSVAAVTVQGVDSLKAELLRMPRLDPVGEPLDAGAGFTYLSEAGLAEAIKFYRGQMALRGWSESAVDTDRRSFARLQFTRAGNSVMVAVEGGGAGQLRVALRPAEALRVGSSGRSAP